LTARKNGLIIFIMNNTSILSQYSLFDGLGEKQIEKITSMMEHEEYEAGKTILLEGANNNKIYLILEGQVRIGKDLIILSDLDKGEIFGEMEVLDVLPAVATAKALSAVKLMTLSIDVLGEIFETDLNAYSFIMTNLARDLSRRVRGMSEIAAGPSPFMEWS
jgi:CRP-like cAMP-binding protein